MPSKKGARHFYLSSDVLEGLARRAQDEKWTWGQTKFIERILRDYLSGGLVSASEVETEKLFLMLFGMGLIDEPRLKKALGAIRSGVIPSKVAGDKFGIDVKLSSDHKSRK